MHTPTGEKHEQKAYEELTQLEGIQRYVYSLVCVASSNRHYLSKDEILLASADQSGEALAALERLTAHHIIVALPPAYRYRARHRVIADLVVKKLQELDELPDILAGVIWAAASKVDPTLNRRARPWRLLARLMNHTFLRRLIGVMAARSIYEQLEQVLAFDYHYLLQRGSLEVEAGDIRLAEQFLGQAYSLQPEDYRVETAYAYMLMRKAAETARDVGSQDLLTDGIDRLEDIIQVHGHETPYPFHVLGSQGLSWARRADFSSVEKRMFLEKILSNVELGLKWHGRQRELLQLRGDIQKDLLLTTVPVNDP